MAAGLSPRAARSRIVAVPRPKTSAIRCGPLSKKVPERPILIVVIGFGRRTPGPNQEAFPVKKISHGQSRRNSARRKRRVKARHARARRRGSRPKPVFGAGGLHYEIGSRISAMSYGGIGAVRRLVAKLGLAREIDRRLELLQRHLPYHESDGGGRLHAALLRVRRDRVDGVRQRGRAQAVAGAGPGSAGAGGLRGRGRDAGAHAGPQEGGHGHVPQGGASDS